MLAGRRPRRCSKPYGRLRSLPRSRGGMSFGRILTDVCSPSIVTMKSSATWQSCCVMRLGMVARSELVAWEALPLEKTADAKARPVRQCEGRYRRYRRLIRQTLGYYSVNRATRRSMYLSVGAHSKVKFSSCSHRGACASMPLTPTCLISRSRRVPACLISAVCLGDGSAGSCAANCPSWHSSTSLEIVVDEFYEQAGSLFVEAYDAPEATALAGRTPNKILSTAFCAVPRPHSTLKPVASTVHDLKSLRVGDRLCSMAVGCLRLVLGIKDQRDPSILTGLEMETKAIWNPFGPHQPARSRRVSFEKQQHR